PDGCPTDPLEKQSYLRALAVVAVLRGKGGQPGKPEAIVVIDHTQPSPDGQPSLHCGLPVELPQRVLDELLAPATVPTLVVRNGVVIEAGGQLDLGRTRRLPNRAQRRALRGLYTTCAIPGCCVRFAKTKIHHVIWWRLGGRTDLANLLPLCETHHQRV